MILDGIVLDLDDTLYDTTGLLLPWADRRAVQAMRAAGLDLDEDAALVRVLELRVAGVVRTWDALAAERGVDPACVEAGESVWFDYDPPPMELDPDVARALDDLADLGPLALLTAGHPPTQRRKVERLGIASRFAACVFADHRVADAKTAALGTLLRERGWTPSRVAVCGDRPDGDVRAANRNGCRAVLVRREGAEFAAVAPSSPDDVPWRTISHVRELPALLRD